MEFKTVRLGTITNKFFFLFLSLAPVIQISWAAAEVFQINQDVYISPNETKKNVISIRGQVKIDGTVQQNVVAIMGHVVVGRSGKVNGNVISVGGKIIKHPGAQIKGQELVVDPALKAIEKNFFLLIPLVGGLIAGLIGATILLGSVGFILLLGALLLLFPKQIERAAVVLWKHPAEVFVKGLLGFVVSIPIIIFLGITIIGIPLSLVGIGVLAGAVIFGALSVAHAVGTDLSIRLHLGLTSFWRGLLGVVILFVIAVIPFLGWVVKIGTCIFGLGAIIQTRFQG